MIPELEILELCDRAESFEFIERTVFEGDRAKLLAVLRYLCAEGRLEVRSGAVLVSAWQIDSWTRNPTSEQTDRELAAVTLEMTEAGWRFHSGS